MCLAFIGDGWTVWLRDCCNPNAGYQQVSALDVIDEEDEEELASAEASPQAHPTKGEGALPSAALANGVAAALASGDPPGEQQQQRQQQQQPLHSPVAAKPAR